MSRTTVRVLVESLEYQKNFNIVYFFWLLSTISTIPVSGKSIIEIFKAKNTISNIVDER